MMMSVIFCMTRANYLHLHDKFWLCLCYIIKIFGYDRSVSIVNPMHEYIGIALRLIVVLTVFSVVVCQLDNIEHIQQGLQLILTQYHSNYSSFRIWYHDSYRRIHIILSEVIPVWAPFMQTKCDTICKLWIDDIHGYVFVCGLCSLIFAYIRRGRFRTLVIILMGQAFINSVAFQGTDRNDNNNDFAVTSKPSIITTTPMDTTPGGLTKSTMTTQATVNTVEPITIINGSSPSTGNTEDATVEIVDDDSNRWLSIAKSWVQNIANKTYELKRFVTSSSTTTHQTDDTAKDNSIDVSISNNSNMKNNTDTKSLQLLNIFIPTQSYHIVQFMLHIIVCAYMAVEISQTWPFLRICLLIVLVGSSMVVFVMCSSWIKYVCTWTFALIFSTVILEWRIGSGRVDWIKRACID